MNATRTRASVDHQTTPNRLSSPGNAARTARRDDHQITILVDQREQAPLKFSDAVGVETVLLPVADYSLRGGSDLVAIERKRLGELATCCGKDRARFIEQLERLRSFPVRALVIEADLDGILSGAFQSNINPLSILGTLIKAAAEWQIPVWFAGDAKNAATLVERMLLWVAKHLNDRPWSTNVLPDSPLAAEVRAVVAEEIRIAGMGAPPTLPIIPLPASLDAEQELCSLLLGGYQSAEQLAPLQPQHFYASVFRNIFEAAQAVGERGEVCGLSTITAELERRRVVGRVLEELQQIRDTTPMVTGLQLRRRINEVMELALRRRLIDVLHRTELSVRTGEFNCDAARAQLEGFFFEVLG